MAGCVKQRGTRRHRSLAFPRAPQRLQRTLQPQTLGRLLLPRHAKLTSITSMSQSGSGAATLTSSMTYNAVHQLVESFDNLGNLTSRTYDADGNLTSVKDPLNHTTTYTYNALNQLVGITNALSNTITYTYDADGRRTGVTNPLSHTTTSTYDRQGRVLTVEAPNAGVTMYTYDVAGNLLSLTDPDNYATTYSYNAINEMVSMTNAMGHQSTYAYNAAGLLTSTTDADGRTITYGYDAIGERTSETWVSGSYTATYDYNAAGLLTLASDPNSTYTYTYDNSGRETSVSNAGTPGVPTVTLSYTYDAYGDRTTLTDSLGGKISYSYDNDLRMSRLSLYTTSNHTLILDAQVTFSYNGASLVTGMTQGLISSSLSYDNANELTSIKDMYSGTTLANYTYGYDSAGELTSYQDNNSSSLTYGYDVNGELTSATGTLNGSSYSVSYSYDANGNRNMAGYTTGSGNELTSDGTYSYTYDHDGNTLTQTEISTGTVTNYTWDYRNRLTEVKVETSGATVLNDEKFTYDVNNNRIAVSLNGTAQLYTVYDGANPYIDFNGSGALMERYLTNPKALSQFCGQVNGSGTVQWFLTDNINSIRQIVSSSGSVLDAITYDPYGSIVSQTNSSNAPRFMYTGGAYDSNTGTYLDGAREDNPAEGRWLSQDPSGLGPDANSYRYVSNNPIKEMDPTGLVELVYSGKPKGKNFVMSSSQTVRSEGIFTGSIAYHVAFTVYSPSSWWGSNAGWVTNTISYSLIPGPHDPLPGVYTIKYRVQSFISGNTVIGHGLIEWLSFAGPWEGEQILDSGRRGDGNNLPYMEADDTFTTRIAAGERVAHPFTLGKLQADFPDVINGSITVSTTISILSVQFKPAGGGGGGEPIAV